MENILIVCVDKDFRKDLSKALATELKCLYLDVDELLNYELLNAQDIALTQASDAMHQMEQNAIQRALEYENCVITISHDLFVANDNFKLINITKIYIHLPKGYVVSKLKNADKYKLEQELCLFDQITKLVKENCNFVIDKGVKTIPQLCKEVRMAVNV